MLSVPCCPTNTLRGIPAPDTTEETRILIRWRVCANVVLWRRSTLTPRSGVSMSRLSPDHRPTSRLIQPSYSLMIESCRWIFLLAVIYLMDIRQTPRKSLLCPFSLRLFLIVSTKQLVPSITTSWKKTPNSTAPNSLLPGHQRMPASSTTSACGRLLMPAMPGCYLIWRTSRGLCLRV